MASPKAKPLLELKFVRSISSHVLDHTHSTPGDKDSRSEASHQLHRTHLSGLAQRCILSFLLFLALGLAWVIGHYQVSPALLALLGMAALYVGHGRWQDITEGAWMEAELQMRRKLRRQLRGESAEWLNKGLNKWWTTCSDSVLSFAKDYVEPLISELLPPGVDNVEVVDVDLGEQTPVISNLRLLDPPTSSKGVASSSSSCTMVALFDLTVPSPDSRIVLRARLGGKNFGCNHVIHVEGLYLSGSLHAVIVLDHQVPFPHVIKISASFISKPDIWFSVKVLKGLKVTGIPLVKSIIHSIVMDVFTTLLVDPGKLTLSFDPSSPSKEELKGATPNHRAVGVVTVTMKGTRSHKEKSIGNARLQLSISIGDKKYKQPLPLRGGAWQLTYSFLVQDLKQDVLVVKMKTLHAVRNKTLAVHTVALDTMGAGPGGEGGQENRSIMLSVSEGACLQALLCYAPLPSLSVHIPNGFPPIMKDQLCGVLYVHAHRGEGLLACDSDGLSDPYCIVYANKQKILHTHYVADTLNPSWERGVEVLVSDITQVVLTFVVLDWDGPLVGDDLMGMAKLTFPDDSSELINHALPLALDASQASHHSLGQIHVSMVFRPIASVGRARTECHVNGGEYQPEWNVGVASSGGKKHVKNRKQLYEREDHMIKGVMEIQVTRGRDLVAKDSNGLSDPYVVIKYGSRVMFRSKVIKETLNPEWNETVTMAVPAPDDIIRVECWDKDIFSDDFMGSVQFTDNDLRVFDNGRHWCKLDHVKHGEILLNFSQSQEDADSAQWSNEHEVPLLEDAHMRGSVLMKSPSSSNSSSLSQIEDSSDAAMSQTSSTLGINHQLSSIHLVSSPNHTLSPLGSIDPPNLKRRHTLSHHSRPPVEVGQYERTTDPAHLPRNPETTADIEYALKRGGEGCVAKPLTVSHKEKQITVYHNVSGQVVEATGLKGELDHMELYIKVRLNTRPSYQRQQKFGRGPVVHKTRVLRGSQSPQWREDFMVKESPVPSDSLLTLDLKSGSKVNIGTYVITLDKFFEGHLKVTRSFDIGNDVKLRVKLSRHLH